jgi:hypothetical protein
MPVTVSVTDTNVFFSPYNTYSDGVGTLQSNNVNGGSTYIRWNTPGAYLRTRFTGASCLLNVDVSMLSAAAADEYPAIEYSVNGGSWTRYQLANGDTQISVASGLGAGPHTLEVVFVAVWYLLDRWSSPPVAEVKVTGLELATAAATAAPTIFSRSIVIYGDSHSEGEEVLGASVTVAHQNARLTFGYLMRDSAQAEVGIIGYSAQGYNSSGGGGIPALPSAWNLYFTGASRLVAGAFSPAPAIVFCEHGTNDNGADDATLQAIVEARISAWRAAAPLAKICIGLPPARFEATAIGNAVTAAADGNCVLADHGEDLSATPAYYNGAHLSQAGHVRYMSLLAPFVAPSSSTGRIAWMRS